MKKLLVVIISLILMITQLAGCTTETSVKLGLSFEKSVFAKEVDGKWNIVDGAKFSKGDKIGLVLLNVSGFKKGDNGLNWMDIDVEVTNPEGKVILEEKGLLGESGKIDLENNIAESPVGSFSTNDSLASGKYSIKVTVYDKIGGGKATNSKSFTLD